MPHNCKSAAIKSAIVTSGIRVLLASWHSKDRKHVDDKVDTQITSRPTYFNIGGNSVPQRSLDTIRFLEAWVTELNGKVIEIDAMGNRLDGLPIVELMFRVTSLEERVAPTSNPRPSGSPDSFVAHKEGCGEEFDVLQNTMMSLFNGLADEFRTTIDAIQTKIAVMSTRIEVTMKAVENVMAWQTNTGSNKLKFTDPRSFKGNRDAKELENFIFDVE